MENLSTAETRPTPDAETSAEAPVATLEQPAAALQQSAEVSQQPAETLQQPADTRLKRAAQTVSWLLHPFAVPLYVLAVMLFTDSYLSHLTREVKTYLVWVVMLYAAIIPALSIGFLRTVGILSDLSISTRRSRVLPLSIGIICYLLCAITISRLASAGTVRQFVLAAACCEAFALAITPFWKISLHLISMGGVTALFFLLNIAGMGHMFWALIAAILCSGLLASARLQLGAHNLLQVAAGFFGGFLVALLAILYL